MISAVASAGAADKPHVFDDPQVVEIVANVGNLGGFQLQLPEDFRENLGLISDSLTQDIEIQFRGPALYEAGIFGGHYTGEDAGLTEECRAHAVAGVEFFNSSPASV